MNKLHERIVFAATGLIESLDGLLDKIPSYEEGRWYRYGGWGCRMNMFRLWSRRYEGDLGDDDKPLKTES